jgi:hypothetical protein
MENITAHLCWTPDTVQDILTALSQLLRYYEFRSANFRHPPPPRQEMYGSYSLGNCWSTLTFHTLTHYTHTHTHTHTQSNITDLFSNHLGGLCACHHSHGNSFKYCTPLLSPNYFWQRTKTDFPLTAQIISCSTCSSCLLHTLFINQLTRVFVPKITSLYVEVSRIFPPSSLPSYCLYPSLV